MKPFIRQLASFVNSVATAIWAAYSGRPGEVVFFGSGGTKLLGTLVLPEHVEPPVPAVVLLHGSERAARSFAYRMHANVFLERGMAVLLYDKRGAGESGGNFEESTYGQLVEDAVSAIAFVRRNKDVQPDRVGLVGVSESGWLTPEIAERSGGLCFVINKVGPTVSWRDTRAWEIYNDLLADNVSEDSAREQIELFQRIWAYYILPMSEEQTVLEAELGRWAERKDSGLPVALKEVDESYVAQISYDPAPYLERLSTPMHYVYGSKDVNVPTDACVERLDELAEAGKPVTYHVFAGAGHELATIGLFPPGYRFVEGYSDLIGEFAERHVG